MAKIPPLHRATVLVRAAGEIAELYQQPTRTMRYAREDFGQIAALLHEAQESLGSFAEEQETPESSLSAEEA